MRVTYSSARRFLILLLALALCMTALPQALAEGSFEAVVSVDGMKVYAQAKPHDVLTTLPRGTVVTVLAWSGKAALVSAGLITGVARVSEMSRVAQTAAPTASATPAPGQAMFTNQQTRVYRRPSAASQYVTLQAGVQVQVMSVNGAYAQVTMDGRVGYMLYSHLSASATSTAAPAQSVNIPVVTLVEAQIYENPDYTGEAVTVRKGYKLTLLAVNGEVAMVTRNSMIGYLPVACLSKDSAPATTQPVSESRSKANPFTAGSNEYIIFNFLINEMKLNRAATMGVMANIYFESSYKAVIDGDGGTSYGLCQWHAGRKTRLINWCTENGLDYNSVEGQMKYLQYELPNFYPSVDSYIRQVENTAEGAYDAAYYFCFNFEAPANRTAQSTKRGNYAKDTLFPKTK
ncbi:MAG: hypothetical protein IJI71_06165 [Clostridia bacterium]|nr:hypothetical protein [Clostridia bacterium]